MPWQLRHQGSPQALANLSFGQIVEGLRDGQWEGTDEVMGSGDKGWRRMEEHPQFAQIVEDVEAPPLIKHDEPTSLDMNALIDVCLVLLIFFILTTSYAAAVQKVVPLPTPKMDEKGLTKLDPTQVLQRMIRVQTYLDKAGSPVIRVENQEVNALADDGKSIDPDKLRDALTKYTSGPDGKKEILLDAKDVTWKTVIAIQDAAKDAHVQTINYVMR